jgi:flagellar motor protein MotB
MAPAAAESPLRQLLTPEHFDADAAIAALEASNMSSRNKISGKAMIDSARTTPPHQLKTALEQIRVVLGLN